MKTTNNRLVTTAFYKRAESAMTLPEVIVLVTVVAILAYFAHAFFFTVAARGPATRALANAKQIGLALRLYANDHNGVYPSFTLQNGKPTTTPVQDSNTAFAQLFPRYIDYEGIFWTAKSRFCSTNPPDEIIDKPPLDVPVETLKRGENEWAYVPGLTDSANPDLPLIVSGFYDVNAHMYTTDANQKGGVWKGVFAVIVRADYSGIVMKLDPKTLMLTGNNGSTSSGDIFTTANSANGWLSPANTVVNPK